MFVALDEVSFWFKHHFVRRLELVQGQLDASFTAWSVVLVTTFKLCLANAVGASLRNRRHSFINTELRLAD